MGHKIFIKIETIRGESTDRRHKDEIDVLAWNWSVAVPASSTGGGGGGAYKPTVSGLSFTHRIDRASPVLMGACFTGKQLKDAVLSIPLAKGNFDYYVIKAWDVVITSVSQSDKAEDDTPIETITFSFGKLTEEYTEVKQDGTPGNKVISCFDIKANRPC